MDQPKSNSRRILVRAAGSAGALAAIGFPAIVRGQPDAVRLGHLTPLTGFLGPSGRICSVGREARGRRDQRGWRHQWVARSS